MGEVFTEHLMPAGWQRHGNIAVPPGSAEPSLDDGYTILVNESFNSVPDANPVPIATLRSKLTPGASSWGAQSTVDPLSIITHPDHGKMLCWTATPNTKNGGVAAFPRLPYNTVCDEAFIEYDLIMMGAGPGFTSDWIFAPGKRGGKWPGLGGNTPDGGSPAGANPPTGGTPVSTGHSDRGMYRGRNEGEGSISTDDEWTGYPYLPLQSAGSYGSVTHSMFGIGSRILRRVRLEMKMNTATGTSGTSYSANGINRVYIGAGGVPLTVADRKYNKVNEVWRIKGTVHIDRILLHFFEGGATDEWGVPGAWRRCIRNFKIGVKSIVSGGP